MNNQGRSTFQNLSYTVVANGLNMAVSIVTALILPKILGVEEYSYWQLYSFYISYVGFFHLGWVDGIYLKYGGKKYADLDKEYFNTQFWLLTIYEIATAVIIAVLAILLINNTDRKMVVVFTGICCVLQIPRLLLQILLQITDRISDYAKNYVLERSMYAVLIIVVLLCGIRRYEILLFADLFAKLFTLLLLCWTCKDIVVGRFVKVGEGIAEAVKNIRVGIKLMFANIAGLLITGVVRFAIENKWDIETFGRISLTMTASNILMIFINAVSVVMYPMLRTTSDKNLSKIYGTLRGMLMVPLFALLIAYYPAKVLLSMWLPQYAESLRYMALLFPMCIYESKMSMLINTYLKALRKEKQIMIINWISVVITVVFTGVIVYWLANLTLAVASLVIVLGLRCILAELYLGRILQIHVKRDIVVEMVMAVGFILISWNIQSWLCTLLYGSIYIMYLAFNRHMVKDAYNTVLTIRKK